MMISEQLKHQDARIESAMNNFSGNHQLSPKLFHLSASAGSTNSAKMTSEAPKSSEQPDYETLVDGSHSNNNNNNNLSPSPPTFGEDKENQLVAARNSNEMDLDSPTASSSKQHVGPVMGIFFKVWSLVKVTKVRHQSGANKIGRRQNSAEETQQFRYIPGDQSQVSTGDAKRGATVLQDSHFRRAASQPAGEPAPGRQLHVSRTLVHSATNSTSSGVSSTTSGSLAANSASDRHQPQQNSAGHTSSFAAIRRQALAAYNSRRATADLAPGGAKPKLASSSSSGNFAAWTSRIRRSATSVQQSDGSRYRGFPFAKQQRRQHSTNETHLRQTSCDELADVDIDDDDDDDDYLAILPAAPPGGGRQLRHASEPIGGSADEEAHDDNDSNEIYSTPYDSVQSVPGGAPNACAAEPTTCGSTYRINTALAHQQSATIGQVHPMTKSYSASNFAQLVRQSNGATRFEQIDELGPGANGSSCNNNNCADQFHSQDSSESNAKSSSTSRRLNGSRFFISSSSSEDSNSPSSQHQRQTLALVQPGGRPASRQPEQVSSQVELQRGVHYHQPRRPDFLALQQQQRQYVGLAGAGAAAGGPGQALGPIPILVPAGSLLSPFGGENYPAAFLAAAPLVPTHCLSATSSFGYKKSPSLFEISQRSRRFSAKYPIGALRNPATGKAPPLPPVAPPIEARDNNHQVPQREDSSANILPATSTRPRMSSSISLHDCKLSDKLDQLSRPARANRLTSGDKQAECYEPSESACTSESEYRLAQMLLELGANPGAKDQCGFTALMHAVLSDNLPAIKCLVEHRVDLNAVNDAGMSAMDLICSRVATNDRLEMLKLLINNGANLDRARDSDGTRLLDRLISDHGLGSDKLAYVECLLQNGAKMGSTTWAAASGKFDIQLRLLKKLCQDGYFLYKTSSIEAAVYRFEYALKRLAALEQQLSSSGSSQSSWLLASDASTTRMFARQIRYQTYLGLSRCERKRKFFKRALEFAQLAILVDSASYEGFYSKAHILKDMGDLDESLVAIDQTARLVDKSIEVLQAKLYELEQQEGESLILDRYFGGRHEQQQQQQEHMFCNFTWTSESLKQELTTNLDYLDEAKRHIEKLKRDIQADKLRATGEREDNDGQQQQFATTMLVSN